MNKKILLIGLALFIAVTGLFLYSEFLSPKGTEGMKEVTLHILTPEMSSLKTLTTKTDQEYLYGLLTVMAEELDVVFLESSFGPMLIGLEGYVASDDLREFYHISINGEDAMVGVKEIPLVEGDVYRFEVKNW